MQPQELAAIRPHLERAVDDIDYFLEENNKRENAREEADKRYRLLDAGWTPPGGLRKPPRLTNTQYMALVYATKLRRKRRPDEPLDERQGKPLTDKEREGILADLELEEVEVPTSDAGQEAFAFWARGGWLESSRQAAVRLRKAGEALVADEIDEALRPLIHEPGDAAERSCDPGATRKTAEYVRTILASCLAPVVPDLPTGFLGGKDLADALGVDPTRRDAFLKQLERKRIKLGDDKWIEVSDPVPNSPKYLCRADFQGIRDLAKEYERSNAD